MANDKLRYKIEGLQEFLKATDPKLLYGPLRTFFTKSAEKVRNEAATRTPVNFGRLRSSLATEVDTAKLPLWAKIGTNLDYAKPVEFGTGLLSDAPDSSHRRYFPPPAALDRWAQLHGGGSGYSVAYAIWTRGGTPPKKFLRDGFEASEKDIGGFLSDAARDVESDWQRQVKK